MNNRILYSNETADFEQLVIWHTVTIVVGSVGCIVNAILLVTFFSFTLFRQQYRLFICLAFGDLCNCLGITLLGVDRSHLFRRILDTRLIPIQTSLSCAAKPYVWLRVIGTLWPPSTQVAIGFDRAACILKPFWYRKFMEKRDIQLCACSCAFVVLAVCIAVIKAVINATDEVSFYCGRKAVFSAGYGLFLYLSEVIGYFFALALNIMAYVAARKVQQTRSVKLQLKKIRYILVLDFFSCMLVAVPNIVSLMTVFIGRVPMWVSEPADWLSSINSSLNFFVYYVMNNEFKRRVHAMFCAKVRVASTSS